MADASNTLQVVVEGKDDTTKVLNGIESRIIRFVGAVSAALATVSVAVFPVKAAADFQRELLNVGKTTDFTDDQLSTLAEGLKSLSYRLNVSATDLAKMAAAGGQMGLKGEGVAGILAFTEAASRLSSVLDITAEDAGAAIGRLTNIFKVSVSEAERISSLLNELSNNSTATGAELIDMVARIGTAGGTLGIKQASALAATGRDLGLTVETVGTSFNKVFLDLQTKAEDIAPVLGMPVEKFSKLVTEDGIGALKLYLNALSRMDSMQRAAFAEKTTGGGRVFALISALVNDANNGFQILDKHLGEANVGFDQGTSAIKEQERVLQGLLAQLQILQNVFIGLAESVGRKALPFVTQLVKELQEWGQSKSAQEAMDRFASSIGMAATAAVTLIKTVAELGIVLGPLLKGVEIYLGYKLLGLVLSLSKAVWSWSDGMVKGIKTWYSLLTGSQSVVQELASEVRAASKKAVDDGGGAASVTKRGQAAIFMDSALSAKYAQADAVKKAYSEVTAAEEKLVTLAKQREAALGRVAEQITYGKENMKAMMQASYDAVISSGGTKKAAKAAANDTKAEINRVLLDMQSRGSNYKVAFDLADNKAAEKLEALRANAEAAKKSLAGMSTLSAVFSAIGAGIAKAGTALLGFLSKAMMITAVISSVAYILDMMGLLDPLLNGLKSMFGILNSADIEEQRMAEERRKDWQEQLRMAQERAKLYDSWKKSQEQGVKTTYSDITPFNNALTRQIGVLENINSKYVSLAAEGVKISSAVDFVSIRWGEINKQLEQAKSKYADLLAKQARQATYPDYLNGRVLGRVSDKEVAAAKAQVDELSKTLDLLGKARDKYSADAIKNEEAQAAVVKDAIEQAKQLAPLYDASGLAALKAYEQMISKQAELDAAKKKADELAKTGNVAGASDKDKQAYLAANQHVHELGASLEMLTAAYEESRSSSATAAIFMANVVPDAAKQSVDKIRSIIRVLGGAGEEYNTALEKTKEGLDKQAADIEAKLADITAKAKAREAMAETSVSNPGSLSASLNGALLIEQVATIRREAEAAALPLKESLGNIRAQQSSLALEAKEAGAVKEALSGVSAAAKDGGQALVASFAATSALRAFTDQQLVAQRRVVEGANFNRDNIKKLYEAAKGDLASVVNESRKEMLSLGQFFNSRKLTLKLAAFDVSATRQTEETKKFYDTVVESEKKRLTELGYSSEEIDKQIKMLQEMLDWSEKNRQSQQDEARQRLIVSELQKGMKQDQADIAEYSRMSAEYAEKARVAQEAGKSEEAANWATKSREEAEKAKLAAEALTDKLKEYKSEAAKPITTNYGAKFIVSEAEVKQAVEATGAARTQAAQANEKALAQAAASSEKFATEQASYYEMLKKSAENYQKIIEALTKQAPGLAKLQNDMAAQVISSTAGMDKVVSNLQSIANTDFRGLSQFTTVSDQAPKIKELETSIKSTAFAYSDTMVPAGLKVADAVKVVVDNLKEVKSGGSEAFTQMAENISKNSMQVKVAFPDAAATLQAQLDSKTFNAKVDFAGGSASGAQSHATGGYISGPGTWTSDSILSWLSNGEYVSDAQTTAFWGPTFFANLKSIARGGTTALGNFATKLSRGISLPAFAGGGYISSVSALGATGGVINMLQQQGDNVVGRVAVDLNVGDQKVSLLGSRKEVDGLIKALHKVNRG